MAEVSRRLKRRRELIVRSRRSGNQEGNKEREQSKRDDGGGRGEAWQAVQRDVPLETENSPAPD